MTDRPDLTRWNRAGLSPFQYVDGNAPVFLELLRAELASRFGSGSEPVWDVIHAVPLEEDERERLDRLEAQYAAERRDLGWEIVRVFARACHLLTGHVDAYANEGFLGTATQWDNVRRLVEMLDYHPAPPASAATPLVLVPKDGARGTVAKGFQIKHAPKSGPPVVFETLEDITVDAALRELRPTGYNRNPSGLSGSTLTFDESVKHLKTGEPVVLEDESSGTLRTYLVQGVFEQAGRTQVTVQPPLWAGFKAGHTMVHAQPADRLTPRGPVVAEAPLGSTILLRQPPGDLKKGEVVYITDGNLAFYRRVTEVRGLAVSLQVEEGSRQVGKLRLERTVVARPELLSVSKTEGGQREFEIRAPGDRTDLKGAIIAALCKPDQRWSQVGEYEVENASFIKPESAKREEDIDPDTGYTLLKLKAQDECTLTGQDAVWVPPAGGGWAADQYLQRTNGRLPRTLVTEKPKKTAAGDIAVVVSGSHAAWARLAAVEADLDKGDAKLEAVGFWYERDAATTFYLADTLVYGHFKQVLRVAGWQDNPTPLVGNAVQLESAPGTLKKGVRLVVECSASDPLVTTVSQVQGATVTLADALPKECTAGDLVLRGNVVSAGHGEAKGEKVLGSGSAALSNQAFTFEVAEVSFVADSTQPTGVRGDITVRVAGREWKQVATLNDSGPADAHYVIRMTEDGYITVQFGDGVNGQRLPTGTNNVRLSYRKGTGLRGNLPAGSLTKPVKPHALIESALQPLAATGGNDMEGTASLRENAPASVLTIERAVSLSDFGHLAATHSSVWQARAFSRPSGLGRREQLEVIVVPANGGSLGDLASALEGFLLGHAMPGVAVDVTGYTEVTFEADVELTVDEEAFVADDVRLAVERGLRDAFALSRRRLGQDVYLSEVYKVVENITGVMHSMIALNGDRRIRRLPTNERSVRVLGALTVRVTGQGVPAGPADGTSSGAPPPSEAEPPIGSRSGILVDGVGTLYAQRLAAAGIDTIRALAGLDPDRVSLQVPRPKLWEAVAKAQILMESGIDPGVAAVVLDRPLVEVGSMSQAALMELTGESAERVAALRTMVRRLQIALDDQGFSTLTLREFVSR